MRLGLLFIAFITYIIQPNNGITTDNQDHDSQQAKDNIIIRLTDLIAAGGEGSVYLAIPLKAQILPVACKIRDSRYGRHSPVRIQEEIEIMRYCQHVSNHSIDCVITFCSSCQQGWHPSSSWYP